MYFQKILLFSLLILSTASYSGCVSLPVDKKPTTTNADAGITPRADPGYLHYLERQSLLANAGLIGKKLSSTDLAWGTAQHQPDKMLDLADTWFFIHPLSVLSNQRTPVFAIVNTPTLQEALLEAGIKGVYIAPTNKSGALWVKNRTNALLSGEDIVQFDFSETAGPEKLYHRLMDSLISRHMLMGGDSIPSATGIGPDFFLATRNHREYPGSYYLREVPKSLWAELPSPETEWEGLALSNEQVQFLVEKNILPASATTGISGMVNNQSFWAITGEIRGIDAQNRRWVYRTNGAAAFATMNFDDPSKNASRIFSASAIQQVGLLGQSLVGLNTEALYSVSKDFGRSDLEPGKSTASSLAREVQNYGGWLWLRDKNISITDAKQFMAAGVDFVEDPTFSTATGHALLTGNAELARFMADEQIRLDIKSARLVHSTMNQDGVSYALPHLQDLMISSGNHAGEKAQKIYHATIKEVEAIAQKQVINPLHNETLYTTGAGLTAMALGLDPTEPPSDKKLPLVYRGQQLLIMFQAMQPGIFMPSGQELMGLLPLHYKTRTNSPSDFQVSDFTRAAYPLTATTNNLQVSFLGVPKGQTLYPSIDVQHLMDHSLIKTLGGWIKNRNQYGIAKGQLIGRPATTNSGSLALLYTLPGNNRYMVGVYNFSQSKIQETLNLSDAGLGKTYGKFKIIAGDGNASIGSGGKANITLEAWQGVVFVLAD